MKKIKAKINNVSKIQQGFTLIEVIIYVGVIGLILVSLIRFSITIQNPREKVFGTQEVDTNARFIMSEIGRQIRRAESINVGTSTFDADPGVLSLEMAVPAENPTIISLDADDGNIQITQGTDPAIILNSDRVKITNLDFEYMGGAGDKENVAIDMTVETTAPPTAPNYSSIDLQTSVTLRK